MSWRVPLLAPFLVSVFFLYFSFLSFFFFSPVPEPLCHRLFLFSLFPGDAALPSSSFFRSFGLHFFLIVVLLGCHLTVPMFVAPLCSLLFLPSVTLLPVYPFCFSHSSFSSFSFFSSFFSNPNGRPRRLTVTREFTFYVFLGAAPQETGVHLRKRIWPPKGISKQSCHCGRIRLWQRISKALPDGGRRLMYTCV